MASTHDGPGGLRVPGNGQDSLTCSSERCLSAPPHLYIAHCLCLHRPTHGARGSASRGNDNLITFLQLTPAVSHPSCGIEGHVQTALPSSLPAPVPARPVSGWWAEGRVPSQCGPVFPGGVRKAGCFLFFVFFFWLLECSAQTARAACPIRES